MARDEQQFQSILQELKDHAKKVKLLDIQNFFAEDQDRFHTFSFQFEDLLLDFSKCAVNKDILSLLKYLAISSGIEERKMDMFSGHRINVTETRRVLHTLLRVPKEKQFFLEGKNIVSEIQNILKTMEVFANGVRTGQLTGFGGQAFTDIVNIGIGGSDLGPLMVTQALTPYHDGPTCHFVSNIDGAHITDTLAVLNPGTTLIIVSSKTFTTIETLTNADYARNWIVKNLGENAVPYHFCAISSAIDKAINFGIACSHIFYFWDWVGGRYSIWSAIGLPVMIAIGAQNFRDFLAGAHAMDEHFLHESVDHNIPLLLGLIGFWHRVICNFSSRAVIPYEQRLSRFPAYLQQLDMESNGKSVTLNGLPVSTSTGPIVWGEPGTNSQHAFFQFLHQGTDIVPVEFILCVDGHERKLQKHRNILLANCLAQAEALMVGCSYHEVYQKLQANNNDHLHIEDMEKLAKHRSFPGSRPSIIVIQDLLTPFSLGRLIALYEHRVFVEGVLMNINSFDQWGVELGKELACTLIPLLSEIDDIKEWKERSRICNASTLELLVHIHRRREHMLLQQ